MLIDVRFKYLDGSSETRAALDLGEAVGELIGRQLQELDGDGWWRSFRHSGIVDAEGFAVFEEDPTVPTIKNRLPRMLEGTVFEKGGVPLAFVNVAVVNRRNGEILGQGSTNAVGRFRLNIVTTSDRVSHHYRITRDGIAFDLSDASVVTETADTKIVELRVR
jgi:hypothetical protein